MASTWIVLLLAAATAAAAVATNTLLDSRRLPAMMSYGGGAFVSSPSTQLELCKSVGTSHVPRFHNTFHRSLPSTVPSVQLQLAMSQSPSTHITLQQQIVEGASLKLLQTKDSPSSSSIYTTTSRVTKDAPRDTKSIPKGQYTYYIREGQRSGE